MKTIGVITRSIPACPVLKMSTWPFASIRVINDALQIRADPSKQHSEIMAFPLS